MPFYCVWTKEGIDPDMYWMQADTEQQARALVATNVPGAAAAASADRFYSAVSTSKKPPRDFIHCRLYGPIPIVRR